MFIECNRNLSSIKLTDVPRLNFGGLKWRYSDPWMQSKELILKWLGFSLQARLTIMCIVMCSRKPT